MAVEKKFLAFDLGAESGRGVLGSVSANGIELEEVHRFANGPVGARGRLYWDHLRLLSEVQHGVGVADASRRLPQISALTIAPPASAMSVSTPWANVWVSSSADSGWMM